MSGPFKYCSQMDDVGLLDFTAPAVDSRITFSRASTRTYFDAAGVMQTAAVDAWPREYDPATGFCRGRAIWPQRTNILLRSQEFDNAVWSKGNLTVTADATAAPDGTTTADKVEATATAGSTGRYIGAAAATATAMTCSIFTKKGNISTALFRLRNETTATNFQAVVFNYDTGVATGAGWRVFTLSNGWYRLTFTQSTGITVGDAMSFYYGAGSTSLNAGDYWYVWGAQLEAGWYESPYIPTTSATVTRSADIATVGTLSTLGWNANAGTIMFDVLQRYEDDGLNNSYFGSFFETTTKFWQFLNNCVTTRTGQINSVLRGDTQKIAEGDGSDFAPGLTRIKFATAFSVANNALTLAVSGELETPDTVPLVMPVPTEFRIGRGAVATNITFGGWFRRIRYYPYRVADANLVKLGK